MRQLQTITLTVVLSLIRAVTTVINRVTQLVAVDAAVVVTAETERHLTLDIHCGWTETASLKKTLRQVQQIKKKSMLFWAGQLLCVLDFLQQRWSSSSELSPQSLSPSHFQWGWTHTWFLHSNRKGGQYVPLGKRVAESEKHSVKFVSVTTLKILNANEAPDQRAIKERAQACTGKTNQRGTLTARRLIRIVQTVWVSIAFEAFSDAVSTATLEVTGMTGPQLWNNSQT